MICNYFFNFNNFSKYHSFKNVKLKNKFILSIYKKLKK